MSTYRQIAVDELLGRLSHAAADQARAVTDLQQLPQRLAAPCAYCGEVDCEDRWTHDRFDAGNEDTWRRRARP